VIRVTVEIVPFGEESQAYKVGTMLIANDGFGNSDYGNYGFAYQYDDRRDVPVAFGTIERFPRNLGAWALVKKVLNVRTDSKNQLTDILIERLESYNN
jgi:hypothetical protein